MGNRNTQGRTVGAVGTSFAIVDALGEQEPCGVTALSRAIDLPKSTVHKHLQTLVEQGYVQQTGEKYRLGFKFLEHGGAVRDQSRIFTHGRSKVESLADEVGELVILSIKEGHRGVFLFRSNDRYNLKESLPMGARFDLHRNAAGKAMLAASDDEYVQTYVETTGLTKATETTITDADELRGELDTIRERGWALNRGERDESLHAVSAAIQDDSTGAVGAVSISIPNDSPATKHLVDEYAEAVQQTASELSLQLEHT